MTLLSLLLALVASHTHKWPKYWTHKRAFKYYFDTVSAHQQRVSQPNMLLVFVVVIVPAIVFQAASFYSANVIHWLIATVVLFACLQDGDNSAHYKQVMKSVSKDDSNSALHHCQSVGCDELNRIGNQMSFLNYSHFFAVILMFVLFDVFGAVLYTTARYGLEYFSDDDNVYPHLNEIVRVLDIIPVRIAGLSYLVVGNFSRGLPIWLETLFNYDTDAKTFLTSIANHTLDGDNSDDDQRRTLDYISSQVDMAKRTVVCLIVVVALLTLFGGIN